MLVGCLGTVESLQDVLDPTASKDSLVQFFFIPQLSPLLPG